MGNAISTLNPLPGTIAIPYPPEGQAHKRLRGMWGLWEALGRAVAESRHAQLPINDLLVPSPTLASRGGGLSCP